MVLAIIPAMVGWSSSETEPGATVDSDFWWLLSSAICQLLSLATFALNLWTMQEPLLVGKRWTWLLIITGVVLTILAIVLYLSASVRLGWMAICLSNAVTAFLQVQIAILPLLLQQTKDKQE
jgi:hypothetical protein